MRNPMAILRDIAATNAAKIPQEIKDQILKDLNQELAAGYADRAKQLALDLDPASKAPGKASKTP